MLAVDIINYLIESVTLEESIAELDTEVGFDNISTSNNDALETIARYIMTKYKLDRMYHSAHGDAKKSLKKTLDSMSSVTAKIRRLNPDLFYEASMLAGEMFRAQ